MFSKSFIAVVLAVAIYAAPLSRRAALDLGSCSDPTIKFANGLDGRTEPAFAPNNSADFNHGSALNIGIIASFICGQLQSACKASQDAIDACNAGEQTASTLTGQAAADAFNKAVTGGASSSSAQSSSVASAPAVSATEASGTDCVATVTVTAAAAPTSTSSTSSSTSSGTSSSSAGANLQTFTGNLGGLPPAVTTGGKGFVTDGSDFLNLPAALGRSCDVQHNACADASNSGAGSFKVSDCDAQDTACKAAAN